MLYPNCVPSDLIQDVPLPWLNLPATRLYEAAGFVAFDRRAVHLVVFPEPPRAREPVP
jgi:hypothetical protein